MPRPVLLMVSQTPAETEWLAKILWTKPKYFELNQESKAVLTENCDSETFLLLLLFVSPLITWEIRH